MKDSKLYGLLQTVQEDKVKVLKGLHQQDENRTYTTTEVIALLELGFALVEASILTEMKDEVDKRKLTNQPTTEPVIQSVIKK